MCCVYCRLNVSVWAVTVLFLFYWMGAVPPAAQLYSIVWVLGFMLPESTQRALKYI
jgi:hypothetical protein